MDNIEEKTESINKQFLCTMLEETISDDDVLNVISAFSYFISKTNKNYKYNLTYLQSYVSDFNAIRKNIQKKNQYITIIANKIKELHTKIEAKNSVVTIDDFWTINIKNKDNDIILKNDFAEIVKKEKICSDYVSIEIKIELFNYKTMCTYHMIKLTNEKQIDTELSQISKDIISLKEE